MTLWDAIVGTGTVVTFDPGAVIVRHGEPGTHCYAIVEGDVTVTVATKQGATVVLRRQGPGAVIGDLAALGGGARSATVSARTPVRAIALSDVEFQTLLRDDPDLALSELRRLARQVTSLTDRIVVRGDELQGRVAQILLTNLEESGDPVFRSTRQELADWVGATREAVTRALARMERQGLVSLGRGVVTVVDGDGLAGLG